MAENLELKQLQRRTLELLQGDLERGSSWRVDPELQNIGPVGWPVGNASSPSRQQMAPILFSTAWDQPHRRSGAVQC